MFLFSIFFDGMIASQFSHPSHLHIRRICQRWWLILVLVLLSLGGSLFFWTHQQSEIQDLVSVIVLNQDILAVKTLETDDVSLVKRPRKWLPKYAIIDPDYAVGKTLLLPRSQGQMLTSFDVGSVTDPASISAKLYAGRALAMDEAWFLARLPVLSSGDRLDILVSYPGRWNAPSSVIAAGISVLEVSSSGGKKTLFVQVTPEEAQAIVSARGLRLPMQVLVRSD